jgi:outer membrane immunogenic protein
MRSTPSRGHLSGGVVRQIIALLLGAAALSTVCSSGAFAADMSLKAAPAPLYNWTGFYVGLNAGYGFNADPTVSFSPADTGAAGEIGNISGAPISYGLKGFVGGLQAGYNWQLNQNWLVGLEGDFSGGKIKGAGQSSFLSAGDGTFNAFASTEVNWFGTVRGRVGYLITPNWLLFGTGGFAYGEVKNNLSLANATFNGAFLNDATGFLCGPIGSQCFVGGNSRVQPGYVVGGGFEYAFTGSLSLKAEYSYVNLGSSHAANVVALDSNGHPTPTAVTAAFSDTAFNIVRLGFNYKY